ncbi:hypothetical protein [Flagellimonas pelagia]|uniref:VWFA domain-containing protein n=1 Tax=Flagellimonas pelagia TaxID=2306998 RepID=A0ABY3KMI6_9FLAO|nr:hypothetical protein [Allomuricauda maritima]TXJ99607.1 hypothetical protein FQ017_01805 [Allomuricauda maritima]
MNNETSRRCFFQQLVLASAGIALWPSLQSCKDKSPTIKTGTGNPPFNVWEEMIEALEKSPDHLIGRRKLLVASKDPEAMTEFVRDSFQIVPRTRDFLHDIDRHSLYGTVVALRCGLATPREKAEILKEMLTEAGFEARVISEQTEITLDQAKEIVFHPQLPPFAPPITDKKIREWQNKLGASPKNGSFAEIPNIEEDSNALADNLLGMLGEQYIKNDPINFRFDPASIPSVVYMENGEEKYAHVFDPNVPAGNLHPTNGDKKFRDGPALNSIKDEEVHITLKYANALDNWNRTLLVEGMWKASELIGNQIKIQFLNNMGFGEQATKSIYQISNFTPCLSLQDVNKDREYLEKHSFLGEPFTLEGERPLRDLELLKTLESDQTVNVQEISSLELKAEPKTFPKVRLTLTPKDQTGNIVEGLKAGNFKIIDNGQEVTGWLQQNMVAPRILLMYDTSLSMPEAYRKEGIKIFLENLKTAIYKQYPAALIILQETGSNIYTSHLKAAQSNNDLVLYATDGDNFDNYDPSFKQVYDLGPPTIYLSVKDDDYLLNKIKENIDINILPAKDQSKIIGEVQKYIQDINFAPYTLTYNSFDESENHEVIVEVRNTSIHSSGSYRFPEPNGNMVGNRIIGLYLEVKIGSKLPIKRVLAGWDYEVDRYENPSRQMAEEVHEMLLGGVIMAFEREGATLSLRFTEYLKTLMSNRKWYEAVQANDMSAAMEALQEGTHSSPPIMLNMMQPLSHSITEKSVTYPMGYRIGLLKIKPGLYVEKSLQSFDFLPTSNYVSITKDGLGAFEETTRKTAILALLENHTFNKSAYSELHGRNLSLNRETSNEERYSTKALGEDNSYFRQRIFAGSTLKFFDALAERKSFWRIDPRTGELYGVLPDMSGGGAAETEASLKALQKVVKEYEDLLNRMNLGLTVTGIGTMPIGIVAAYSLILVKLYAMASEALILMDASGMDQDISAALQELACNVYKEILYNSLGRIGTGASAIEGFIAAMGGNFTFFDCSS